MGLGLGLGRPFGMVALRDGGPKSGEAVPSPSNFPQHLPAVNLASQVWLLPTDNTARWYWTAWTDSPDRWQDRNDTVLPGKKPPQGDLLPSRLGTVLQPTHKAVTQNQKLVICRYCEIGNAEWHGFLWYTCTNTTPTFPPILEMAILNKNAN